MPSTAANSSVTHSTPAASSPSTERRSSAKWKSTKVLTLNSSIAGTASPVRSSTRRSLRTRALDRAPHAYSPSQVAGADLARRRQQLRPAAAQAEHEVGLRQPLLDVVRDQHARGAARAPDQRRDGAGRARVEVGERLVEQQQLRLVQQRPADRHPLGHAARQRAHRLVAAARHADRLEQLLRPRRAARRAGARGSAGSRARSGRGRAAGRGRRARSARAPPSPRAAARGRARAPRRRAGAAASPARAAASSCRRRWRRTRRAWRRAAAPASRPASATRSP